uniref:Sui m 9 allergen n=1 Tax=Suidasia medanensis TaxID=223625 RepID=B2GM92_9ACAR|nr:Sui m 9 allergen [Suidasia medanensis]
MMKLTVALLCTLCAVVSADLRLPLPEVIQREYPWLIDEPINSDNDAYSARIVGGSNVGPGEAKHQIALLRSGSFTCGGSLISSKTVLTAAHCVYGNENKPTTFTIRYNTLDRTSGPTIGVKKVNRHASYSSNTIDYDVATLTLSSAFAPGDNAAVIGLASTEPAANEVLKVTGWGRLSAGGSLPTKLQQANLNTISRSDCQKRWGSTNTITARMICAHSTTQSACNGDSGGPITKNGLLVGVVSWGSSSCLHQTYPNVYANVANLKNWINANTV